MNVRDVGMVERGEDLRFAAEAREPLRVVRDRGQQHLDGDIAIQFCVARATDLAHAAGAERREDLVRTETMTC